VPERGAVVRQDRGEGLGLPGRPGTERACLDLCLSEHHLIGLAPEAVVLSSQLRGREQIQLDLGRVERIRAYERMRIPHERVEHAEHVAHATAPELTRFEGEPRKAARSEYARFEVAPVCVRLTQPLLRQHREATAEVVGEADLVIAPECTQRLDRVDHALDAGAVEADCGAATQRDGPADEELDQHRKPTRLGRPRQQLVAEQRDPERDSEAQACAEPRPQRACERQAEELAKAVEERPGVAVQPTVEHVRSGGQCTEQDGAIGLAKGARFAERDRALEGLDAGRVGRRLRRDLDRPFREQPTAPRIVRFQEIQPGLESLGHTGSRPREDQLGDALTQARTIRARDLLCEHPAHPLIDERVDAQAVAEQLMADELVELRAHARSLRFGAERPAGLDRQRASIQAERTCERTRALTQFGDAAARAVLAAVGGDRGGWFER
jgi:hypothetical protein